MTATTHLERSPSTAFGPFLAVVIAAGAAVIGVEGLRILRGGLHLEDPLVIGLFAGLMLVAETHPVWTERQGTRVVCSLAFAAALVFVTPGLFGAVVAAGVSVVADTVARRPLVKVWFNAAMAALMMAAAIGVLHLGGVPSLLDGSSLGTADAATIVLACAAMYAVNTVLSGTVVGLHRDVGVVDTIRAGLATGFVTDAGLLPLGPIMVVLYANEPVLLPLGVALTGVVYATATFAVGRHRDATVDPLTGLANRRHIDDQAEQALALAARDGRIVAVMMMDLDGFKPINDTFGHAAGDEILRLVAHRGVSALPSTAAMGRVGGDEFLVVADVESTEQALALAESLTAAVAEPMELRGTTVHVAGSVGVAFYPLHGRSVAELARAADAAMYAAKQGRLGCVVADQVQVGASPLVAALGHALSTDDPALSLEYQPVFDLHTGEVVGVEGVLGWSHPTLGRVQPSAIIAKAEATMLIHELTDWVLRTAIDHIRRLHDAGHRIWVATDVSGRDLANPQFADHVATLLDAQDVEGRWLVVEVTDPATSDDLPQSVETCRRLAALDVTVVLDDFGDGHRSIVELRDLPVAAVKLDPALVARTNRPRDRQLIAGLIRMVADLDVRTIAHGVNSPASGVVLKDLGCDQMQGDGLARAMPPEALSRWLTRSDTAVLPVGGVPGQRCEAR